MKTLRRDQELWFKILDECFVNSGQGAFNEGGFFRALGFIDEALREAETRGKTAAIKKHEAHNGGIIRRNLRKFFIG